jgi:hypothetical protein
LFAPPFDLTPCLSKQGHTILTLVLAGFQVAALVW